MLKVSCGYPARALSKFMQKEEKRRQRKGEVGSRVMRGGIRRSFAATTSIINIQEENEKLWQ